MMRANIIVTAGICKLIDFKLKDEINESNAESNTRRALNLRAFTYMYITL